MSYLFSLTITIYLQAKQANIPLLITAVAEFKKKATKKVKYFIPFEKG